MTDIQNNGLLKGSLWTSGGRWCVKIIGLLSTIIIVRVLVPNDFGLMMKAILVLSPFERVAQTGFCETLLCLKNPQKKHYDTAFTLNLILGIALALLLSVTAGLWAKIFYQEELKILLPLLAFKVFFVALVNPATKDLQRDFHYRKDFLFIIMIKIVNVASILCAILYFRNYMGLAVGQTVGALLALALSYYFVPYRPNFSLEHRTEFINYSVPNMKASLADYGLSNLDRLLLARYIPIHTLGMFNLAAELAEQFTTEIIYPLARSFFPVFVALEGQPEKLRYTYLQGLSFLLPLCFALGAGLSWIAHPLILLYAGEVWKGTDIFLQVLSISAAAQAFCLVNSAVLSATGHIKARATLTSWQVILSLGSIFYFAITGQVMLVLYIKAIITLLFALLNIALVAKILHIPYSRICDALYRPIIACTLMIFFLSLLPEMSALKTLISHVLIGAFIYISSLLLLWILAGKPDSAEKVAIGLVRKYV